MDGLIILRGYGIQFGKANAEPDSDICIFGENAALFYSQNGKLSFESRCL